MHLPLFLVCVCVCTTRIMASQERSPLDRDYAKWERILAHEEVVQNRSESVANREYTPSGEALWLPYIESRQESSELTKNLTAKESHPKEIWQIVVKPLRVWAAASRPAPSGEVLPCRPRFMFVGNLYPTGKLLYRRACDPPEEQPSTFFVLDAIKQLILTPPEDQPQHRPGKIVFSDKDLAVKLHTSLERIGIDCGYLSEADAFDDYARAISKHLLEKEMADVSPSNNKPGLLSVSHVTEELFKRFWNATQEFYALSPWKFTKERQCFRIRVPEEGHPLPYVKTKPGNLWVGVLGYSSTVDDDPDPESEESNNNDDDDDEETTVAKKRQGVRGLCMFYNRWDAEQRMMSSVDPDLPEKQIAHALPHPSDLHCQRSECGAATGDLKRCSRCKEVYYCSRECQQQDWNRHAKVGILLLYLSVLICLIIFYVYPTSAFSSSLSSDRMFQQCTNEAKRGAILGPERDFIDV